MTVSELDLDIDFLCGSTSATYSPTNKRRNMNIEYRNVAQIIWESDGGWHYDDSNATTLNEAYTTLVHNQKDYTIPSTAQRIDRVEVLDSNGNYIKLNPLDRGEVHSGLSELYGNPGLPQYYELQGRSLLLYPTPHSAHVTETAGLYLYLDRNVTDLAVTATTTEPGFAAPFHRILSYACAMDFTQDASQRQWLAQRKEQMTMDMRRFYAKRAPEHKTNIKPQARRNWRKYT